MIEFSEFVLCVWGVCVYVYIYIHYCIFFQKMCTLVMIQLNHLTVAELRALLPPSEVIIPVDAQEWYPDVVPQDPTCKLISYIKIISLLNFHAVRMN